MTQNWKKVNEYIIHTEQLLGQGQFAKVMKCHHHQTGQQFAVKIISKEMINKSDYSVRCFLEQLYAHKSLRHTNIVKYIKDILRFIDVLQTTHNYYIVQQYCEGGSLRDKKNKLNEKQAIKHLTSICFAYSEFIKAGIIHRDLKPENILFKNGILKLADFGLAKKVVTHRQLNSTMVGTPIYMSPQILKSQKYSSKCDVWSVGIILYELLYGQYPWKGNNCNGVLNSIINQPLYFRNSIQIKDQTKLFIKETLRIQQTDRISWIQIFQHQIFQGSLDKLAIDWRNIDQRVGDMLVELYQNVTASELISIFFSYNKYSIDFNDFIDIIKHYIPTAQNTQLGVMYVYFDKDSNGVIDLIQFLGEFSFCNNQALKLIQKLIQKQHKLYDLCQRQFFMHKGKLYDFDSQIIDQAYLLISKIEL